MSEQRAIAVGNASQAHPIHLVVTDDLVRNRLTVFFWLLLVIPHLIWLALWGIVVWFAVLAARFVGIFTGRVPDGLHDFIAGYLRYLTHVYAYRKAASRVPGHPRVLAAVQRAGIRLRLPPDAAVSELLGGVAP